MSPEQLKDFVSELFDVMGMSPTSISIASTERLVVAVTIDDSEKLIGPNGDHLRALNTLARRIAEKKSGAEVSFLIDINGYHEEQLEKIRGEARMLAQRARLFKHDVEMEPLSSYERLVIHELFAEDPEIETVSAGEGKFRHIVLKYKEGSVK